MQENTFADTYIIEEYVTNRNKSLFLKEIVRVTYGAILHS